MLKQISRWHVAGFLSLAIGFPAAWLTTSGRPSAGALPTGAQESGAPSDSFGADEQPGSASTIRVETVHPQPGGIERTATQPGTVIAFESARLFAKLPGYLKSQNVDIGSHVHSGEVLAEIEAPELIKEVDQKKAALEQTKAQFAQMQAHVATALADQKSAEAAIEQAAADVDKTKYYAKFREKQYTRINDLFKLKSVDERLVDEKLDEFEAAQAAERLAVAGMSSAKALAAAAAARVDQAHADVADAKAKIDIAEAELEKAKVLASYLQIVSPYDGVITERNFFPGDFIRSADQSQMPLLAVDRTDKMRVVVQVADTDVPYVHVGNEATMRIPALPGIEFKGKVSRLADAQDRETRTMRVEVDLSNHDNLLRAEMFGRTIIHLASLAKAVQIPSSCLVGDASQGEGKVYVVRDGVAHLEDVEIGRDDGLHVEVVGGLNIGDVVVAQPGTTLFDGAQVAVVDESQPAETNQAVNN